MTAFALDPRLAADTLPVGRFAVSRLLLMNDATYPWLILVPERAGISELFELDPADLEALVGETALVGRMLKALVAADKVNVAALGNVVSQLHVHVVARFATDPAWPGPVWGRAPARAYGPEQAAAMLHRVTGALARLAEAATAGGTAVGERATTGAGKRAGASGPMSPTPMDRAAATWRPEAP